MKLKGCQGYGNALQTAYLALLTNVLGNVLSIAMTAERLHLCGKAMPVLMKQTETEQGMPTYH